MSAPGAAAVGCSQCLFVCHLSIPPVVALRASAGVAELGVVECEPLCQPGADFLSVWFVAEPPMGMGWWQEKGTAGL